MPTQQPNREGSVPQIDFATATPFYLKCSNAIVKEKLTLPTIPDAAMKIRRAINDQKANNMRIARVVQTDPTITARLIQISNSPFYRGRKTIESCPEALTRLGLKVAQDLITSFSLKTVFKAKSRLIQSRMNELWQHSSYVAAICAVLAHKTPGFDPDRAMLAGLVHDIGSVPILTLADGFPELGDDPSPLDKALADFRGHAGALIMRKWNFPKDFEDIVLHAEDWYRNQSERPDYTDLVIVSQLHSFVGNIGIHRYPKMHTLPAYTKLVTGKLDADLSMNILEIAKDEIWEIQKLLIS